MVFKSYLLNFVWFSSYPAKSVDPDPPKESWTIEPSVIHLNDGNFKQELRQLRLILVMFYVPWCGHCKKIKPEYIGAAKELEQEGISQCLAMIDCTVNPVTTEEFKIEGFPTIKLFKNGKFITDYNGQRTMDEIKKFFSQYYNQKDEL